MKDEKNIFFLFHLFCCQIIFLIHIKSKEFPCICLLVLLCFASCGEQTFTLVLLLSTIEITSFVFKQMYVQFYLDINIGPPLLALLGSVLGPLTGPIVKSPWTISGPLSLGGPTTRLARTYILQYVGLSTTAGLELSISPNN